MQMTGAKILMECLVITESLYLKEKCILLHKRTHFHFGDTAFHTWIAKDCRYKLYIQIFI